MGVGEGGRVLIVCSIQPFMGPSKVVYISYTNEIHSTLGSLCCPC